MKVEEAPLRDSDANFVPFCLRIEVCSKDELIALTRAAGRMTNGHGLQLYDLLIAKCKRFDVNPRDVP